jgi:hypothetical protein
MKKTNQLDDLKKTISPKDWSAGRKPATLNTREKKEEKK